MHFIYVLYNRKYHKIYIGYSIDPNRRLQFHNDEDNKGYTKRYQPWEIIYTEEFETMKEALDREKQLKTARGRDFIWTLIAKKMNDEK